MIRGELRILLSDDDGLGSAVGNGRDGVDRMRSVERRVGGVRRRDRDAQSAQNDIRWVALEVSIPDEVPVTTLAPRQVPRDWRREPPPAATMRIGSAWLRQADTAVLRVPSAIVPAGCSYILKPAHSEFHKLRIAPPTPFSFDSRMWK
jgi:RES domain-containing protein